MEDPYKILGVARDASQEDIRRAYRNLAKQHHPDLNPGNKAAEEHFKVVSGANELLSDPIKRGRFDRGEIDATGQERAPSPSYRDYAESEAGQRYSGAGPDGGGWSADEFNDVFGNLFNERRSSAGNAPARGRDERYALSVAFLDAVNGATRRISLPEARSLEVKIPPATEDGQILRLRGQGGAGRNGGPKGDVLIEIEVLPHKFFRRDGQDIRLELPVTVSEAVLGASIEVPTPGGPVRMRLPPQSDSGTELRLRGRGVPAHGDRPAGQLYATLRVVIGKPDAALEEFLRGWAPENPANPRENMGAGT